MYRIVYLNKHDRPSKAATEMIRPTDIYAGDPVVILYNDDPRQVTELDIEQEDRLKDMAAAAFPGRSYRVLPASVASIAVTTLEGRSAARYALTPLPSYPVMLRGEHADEDYRGQSWRARITGYLGWSPWSLVCVEEVLPFKYETEEQLENGRNKVRRMVYAASPGIPEFRITGADLRFARAVPVRTEERRPVRNRRQTAGRRL